MQIKNAKTALLGLWALSTLVVGVAAGVSSAEGLLALAAVALVPPTIAWRLWREPPQTLSESIQHGRR